MLTPDGTNKEFNSCINKSEMIYNEYLSYHQDNV